MNWFKKNLFHLSLFISLLLKSSVFAEIETVTIKWTSMLCLQTCVIGLDHQFRLLPAVADVQIDEGAGRAILRWRPGATFSYPPIETALAMIGISYDDFIRIKVRGTVIPGAPFTLVSSGDQTPFVLLGPVEPSRTDQVIIYNIQTHTLSPQLKEQLLQAAAENSVVTIEGPLLSPERSPPLMLIVENLQVSKQENPGNPR